MWWTTYIVNNCTVRQYWQNIECCSTMHGCVFMKLNNVRLRFYEDAVCRGYTVYCRLLLFFTTGIWRLCMRAIQFSYLRHTNCRAHDDCFWTFVGVLYFLLNYNCHAHAEYFLNTSKQILVHLFPHWFKGKHTSWYGTLNNAKSKTNGRNVSLNIIQQRIEKEIGRSSLSLFCGAPSSRYQTSCTSCTT